jgi:hypothetical protein
METCGFRLLNAHGLARNAKDLLVSETIGNDAGRPRGGSSARRICPDECPDMRRRQVSIPVA